MILILFVVPFLLFSALGAVAQQGMQPEARQLFQAANQARSAAGARPLQWDPALGLAARQHCLRMAAEGTIGHRYRGEADLTARAAQNGAHFSVIEENVAEGPTPAGIHDAWMHSSGHRGNLLNTEVDRVGIAVVAGRGNLYAVADYSRSVEALTAGQVEATVANLLRPAGLTVRKDASSARNYCASSDHLAASGKDAPSFVMRWQGADLGQLPEALLRRIGTGLYHQAVVGSCQPHGLENSFTAYRVAVLLY